jgi:photosystem II stability/assembly factor-like uncharacterized protein
VKNRLIVGLLLVAALAPSCGGGGGGGGGSKHPVTAPRWQETFRTPTSIDLRAVRFGNAMSGIVAGKFGSFVRTDDGGAHWRQLEISPATTTGDILSLAVAQTTAFAVGQNPGGGAIAWISLDANNFGQPDTLPTTFSEPWVDVSMVYPAGGAATAATLRLRPSGLIDAYQGNLLNTWDSKHNDQTPAPPPVPDTPWTSANGLVALGPSGVWYVCGDNGGFAQIRKTTNDGTFFSTSTVPASTPVLRRMSFLNLTQGFACGKSNTILYTTDGTTWSVLPGNPGGLPAGDLLGIGFWDTTHGFAVGQGGRIYRLLFTSVWTWEVMTSGTTEDLYDVTFGDGNTAYAVGNNGVVVKTSNASAGAGSVTWTVKSGPAVNPTAVFNAVDFRSDALVGLAVGNGGALYRTLDAGATWTLFNTGIGGVNLTSVSIPRTGSGTVAFVGASTGALFVNTDFQGTGTWAAPTSGAFPASPVRALLFPKDDSTGIAAGDAGSFARLSYASPGGLTVSPQALVPAQAGTTYAAAADPTGNTVYLAGDNGYIAESTNNGATWAGVLPTPPVVSFRGLAAPNGAGFKFFAAASTGDIHRLSAGGSPAWSATAGAAIGTPVGMSFVSDLTGIVITQDAVNGGVYYTATGGGLWTKSILHVPVDAGPHVLNGVWLHPSLTAFVVGGNGLIMRTTTLGQ